MICFGILFSGRILKFYQFIFTVLASSVVQKPNNAITVKDHLKLMAWAIKLNNEGPTKNPKKIL
jgi:hypothetical protein